MIAALKFLKAGGVRYSSLSTHPLFWLEFIQIALKILTARHIKQKRRAPFDTSQVLIGPPCLNKVDFDFDFKYLFN